MAIEAIEVINRVVAGFGLQSEIKVTPPLEENQLSVCARCPLYTHGCSGPRGVFNNRLVLNFSKYFDDALKTYDEALCGLRILWRVYLKKIADQEGL